jgi:hypothetical protein
VRRNNDINFKAIQKRRRALSSYFVGGGGGRESTAGTLGTFPWLESIRVVSPKVLSILNEANSSSRERLGKMRGREFYARWEVVVEAVCE